MLKAPPLFILQRQFHSSRKQFLRCHLAANNHGYIYTHYKKLVIHLNWIMPALQDSIEVMRNNIFVAGKIC